MERSMLLITVDYFIKLFPHSGRIAASLCSITILAILFSPAVAHQPIAVRLATAQEPATPSSKLSPSVAACNAPILGEQK
jgi:hypothetical protein